MKFTPATRRQARLRLALSGPSGSGKTYSALQIAKGLGGRVAVIDTEHRSASLYAHLTPFDVLELSPPFTPERYIEAIRAAEAERYDVIVIDSITHEWNGSGGLLEIVDQLSQTKFRGNSYAAWASGTPRHRAFLESMLQSSAHVIATMRSKTAYVEGEKGGKKSYVKAGMAPEQRDGVEYEFTVVLDLDNAGNLALASKDRTSLFVHRDPFLIGEEIGVTLARWLETGEADVPAPKQEPAQQFSVEWAIAELGKMNDAALITVFRDSVKANCEDANDIEGYKRFVKALRERIATLATSQE